MLSSKLELIIRSLQRFWLNFDLRGESIATPFTVKT